MYKINRSNWKLKINVNNWDISLSKRFARLKNRANSIETIRTNFNELFITEEGIDSIECIFFTGEVIKPSEHITKYILKNVNCSIGFIYEENSQTKEKTEYTPMTDEQLLKSSENYIDQEIDLVFEFSKLKMNISYLDWLKLKETNVNKIINIVGNYKQQDTLFFYSAFLKEIQYQINCETSRLIMNEKYKQFIVN